MGVTIQDIRVICTAPEGINLVVIKVETNQPGLYGLGCGTFAYRHLLVKQVVEEYLKPVSYTHLDVYKRQALWGSTFWRSP